MTDDTYSLPMNGDTYYDIHQYSDRKRPSLIRAVRGTPDANGIGENYNAIAASFASVEEAEMFRMFLCDIAQSISIWRNEAEDGE